MQGHISEKEEKGSSVVMQQVKVPPEMLALRVSAGFSPSGSTDPAPCCCPWERRSLIMQETWMEDQAPGFSLALAWPLIALQVEPMEGRTSLFLPPSRSLCHVYIYI